MVQALAEKVDEAEWKLGIQQEALRRDQATAELQLGDEAKFFPSDAALASWMAQADAGQAQIVYETA